MSKKRMTAAQLCNIGKLCENKGVDFERAEAHFQAGLLADLLAVENPAGIDRQAFQTLLTAKPNRNRLPVGLVDSELFEPIVTVSVSKIEAFGAKEQISVGIRDGVKISEINNDFKKYFLQLNRTGKNELGVPAQKLRVHELRMSLKDPEIIANLGGEIVIEIHLATMFELLKKQGMGQANGPLLVNGGENFFYIRDDNSTLFSVNCRWLVGSGWKIQAKAVSYDKLWSAGSQVFSR